MKLTDYTFRGDVSFNDMLVMAGQLVESLYGDADNRLGRMIGQEYLVMQAEMRLFTNYGMRDEDGDAEGFMQMVFSCGVERFREWLRSGAGQEKFDAFERMIERGAKQYLDMSPLDKLVDELSEALHKLNQMLGRSEDLTPDKAVELLKLYLDEQKPAEEEASPEE